MEDYHFLPLPPPRLENFLLGLRLTFSTLASPAELKDLVDSARSLFGSHRPSPSPDFTPLLTTLMLRQLKVLESEDDKDFLFSAWPLLGALMDLQSQVDLDGSDEGHQRSSLHRRASSSSSDVHTPTNDHPSQQPTPTKSPNLSTITSSPVRSKFPVQGGKARANGHTEILLSDFASSVKLLRPRADGKSVLMVEMGGKSLMVLPNGLVICQLDWGQTETYDLNAPASIGELEPAPLLI